VIPTIELEGIWTSQHQALGIDGLDQNLSMLFLPVLNFSEELFKFMMKLHHAIVSSSENHNIEGEDPVHFYLCDFLMWGIDLLISLAQLHGCS
jgi:hypothetical protein